VAGSTTVEDSAVEMGWMADMQNFVVEMAWNIVDMEMVVGIVAGIAEVAGFRNHILSNFEMVVVDIVVEAKLAMALEESKDFEVDRYNFAEGIVVDFAEASEVAMVSVVLHSKNLLFLVLLP